MSSLKLISIGKNIGVSFSSKYVDFGRGSLTLGYKSTFAGWNSEGIRHIGQNKIAHDWIQKGMAKHFQILPNAPNQGFYSGFRRSNLFTTW